MRLLASVIQAMAEEAAHPVAYELRTMSELPRRLIEARRTPGSPVEVEHACLESCLLHARAILEFLGARGFSDTRGIRACDFAPEFAPRTHLRSRWIDPIDAHLAHLSWQRVLEPGRPRGWTLAGLLDDVNREFGLFLTEVPPGRARDVLEHAHERSKAHRADLDRAAPPTEPLVFSTN